MSTEPLDWTEDGPRSPRFDDVYFSKVDGLAESRAVFLAGCGLPQAWAGRARFTVAELGFGTGLNVLALVELWRRTRAPGARLNIFSVEGFPIGRDDAARALAAWPELADLSTRLVEAWPDGRRGLHRIEFDDEGVVLDLAIAEVGAALDDWDGAADAWFLDGFAPSRNPQMWRPELFSAMADRSAPGARAATFTVAGVVRRGLEAAGFAVEKQPGFGRKRERLEVRASGEPPVQAPSPRVAVVGAGIAGAALVRAFRALGVEPTLYEADRLGAGASGNPAALVTPRLDAGLGPVAQLHAQAFARAVTLYENEHAAAIMSRGALQLAQAVRDAGRFERLAAWDGFDTDALQRLDPAGTGELLGEPGPGALWLRRALTIVPAPILEAWLAGCAVVRATVARVERDQGVWLLYDAAGARLGEAGVVCLAAGPAVAALAGLPLRPVRGQASWSGVPFTGMATAWGGYAVPAREGVLFGSPHDRDDTGVELRVDDHVRNLDSLRKGRPHLAARLEGQPLSGRASLRAASPDHLPLAGAVPGEPGLFVLSGLGGRGFTLAPLLAEQVAAQALRLPRPLPRSLGVVVDPARFEGR